MSIRIEVPTALQVLHQQVENCSRCGRLRDHCQTVAIEKRAAYSDWIYWGKPVSGYGDPRARLWIVGLAPGAHGANRTGRVFTGDRSGDFLFAALHRVGMANQPASRSRDDGLRLNDCYISAAARCAPPGNKPLPAELAECSTYLDREWDLLTNKQTILALGGIAWQAVTALARRKGCGIQKTPMFGHGVEVPLCDGLRLLGSYHVSQQNTFTGRLTPAMFDAVLRRCLKQ